MITIRYLPIFAIVGLAAILLLLLASPMLASEPSSDASQAIGDGLESTLPETQAAIPSIPILYSLVGLGGILVVVFKKPKRTRSD